jgi:hypothetical protein
MPFVLYFISGAGQVVNILQEGYGCHEDSARLLALPQRLDDRLLF